MPDATELVNAIKQAAVDAVNASKPANVIFGNVISASPLKIQIDQKLTLGSAQLVVCKHLTNYYQTITLEGETKTVTVFNSLKKNDHVILLQAAGGQKFIVLDRV